MLTFTDQQAALKVYFTYQMMTSMTVLHCNFSDHKPQPRSQGFVRSSAIKRLQLLANFVKSRSISNSGPGDELPHPI